MRSRVHACSRQSTGAYVRSHQNSVSSPTRPSARATSANSRVGALAPQDLDGYLGRGGAHRRVLPDGGDRPRCPHHAGMPLFERSCVVRAPIAEVFAFHLDTRNAARISPRTMPVVGVHGSFPLTEGDEVEIVVRLWPTPLTPDLARRGRADRRADARRRPHARRARFRAGCTSTASRTGRRQRRA